MGLHGHHGKSGRCGIEKRRAAGVEGAEGEDCQVYMTFFECEFFIAAAFSMGTVDSPFSCVKECSSWRLGIVKHLG